MEPAGCYAAPLLLIWWKVKNLMAEGLRRSTRNVKSTKKEDHIYEDDIIECIVGRNSEVWQPQPLSDCSDSNNSTKDISLDNNLEQGTLTWSVLENLPNYRNLEGNSDNCSTDSYSVQEKSNLSQVINQNTQSSADEVLDQCSQSDVNKPASERRNSSTKHNFLDLPGNFFSAASSSAFSNMSSSDTDNTPGISKCKVCSDTKCKGCTGTGQGGLEQAVLAAVEKIDALNERMTLLEDILIAQRGASGSVANDSSSDNESSSGNKKSKKHHKKGGKSKLDRVEFERERSLKVMREKLEARKKKNKKKSESEEGSSSDEEVNVKKVRKKMSHRQKLALGHKVSSRLSEAGASFPEDSSTLSEGSGTDTSKVSCHRHKKSVKSGAKVRKRPVKRTEIWPHTIANEEDDSNVTHESIILSKFLTCFTYIMNNCENETEAAGRAVLLEAITNILDCQPWTEARSFHNTIMTKIEQERINWKTNFIHMAKQFIDKKVREMLRSRPASSGYDKSYRGNSSGNSYRNFGRGNSNYAGRGQSGQVGASKPMHLICRQWNFGTCSFSGNGKECKRWHACWTCAYNGKIGEPHKASSHDNTGDKAKQGQGGQRF